MNGKELRRDIERLVDRYGAEYIVRQVGIVEAERAKAEIEKARHNENLNTRRRHRANRSI